MRPAEAEPFEPDLDAVRQRRAGAAFRRPEVRALLSIAAIITTHGGDIRAEPVDSGFVVRIGLLAAGA